MKKLSILISLLIVFTLNAYCQLDSTDSQIPVSEKTGLITYQEVIQEEGTRRELFNRAQEWLHQFFANPVYVTKKRDAASGVIKGRHQIELTYIDDDGYKKIGGMVMYSFNIECRDGRYRYTITDFQLKQTSKYPLEKWLDKSNINYNPQWEKYLEQVDDYCRNEFGKTLQEAMEPKEVIEEEEW